MEIVVKIHFYKKVACLTPELKKFNGKPFRDYLKKFAESHAYRLQKDYETAILRGGVAKGEENVHFAIYCRRYSPTDSIFYANQTVYGREEDVAKFVEKHPTDEGWDVVGSDVLVGRCGAAINLGYVDTGN
jgi:hypothetical protein